MQPADNQFTRPGRRGDRAGLESKEVPLATMQRPVGSAFSASSAVENLQIRNLNGANRMSDMAGNAARVAVECGGRCRDTMERRG